MKNKLIIILLALMIWLSWFLIKPLVFADENSDKLNELNKKIEEYTQKISELQGEQKTLATTISYINSKIQLSDTKIAKTEEELKILSDEITKLSVKIDLLQESLVDVAKIFGNRVQESYKRSFTNPFFYLLSNKGFTDTLSRLEYLKIAQLHDRELLLQMQESKMNYGIQKQLKEDKQAQEEALKKQLVAQQLALAQQKQAKQQLLEVTKNDEQKFQSLLAQTRAEYQAIQGILAGYGQETKVGPVKEGEKIATVISGDSCNSSGTHLHFMVARDGNPENPFNYLKSVSYTNCSSCYTSTGCPCSEPDPFNPSGDWNWPLEQSIILNQGYGSTWAIKNTWVGRIYNFHNGIDIIGASNDVKAVKTGTLYRGSYSVGCALPYVKVEHQDSNIATYYLHVNY